MTLTHHGKILLKEANAILDSVDTCQLTIDFVRFGHGVGLIHGLCAGADLAKDLRQIDMTRHFARTGIALITRSNAALRPAARALMQAVIDDSARFPMGEPVRNGAPKRRRPKGDVA